MSDDMQMLRDLGEVKAELSAVKAELAGLRERIDDVVISNLGYNIVFLWNKKEPIENICFQEVHKEIVEIFKEADLFEKN